ncbi:hypothetical protein [Chitinophaga nivalis]|uniref:Helix-turn-helix type 11 domain-containing protein n=1 Tax=Chitinophaga nivalis TaxID=2991709 RepID=A0ABT3IEV1_9BACT|nr:hypothetical protein [Chitinophaga nivalis]MCW3467825.1 hypothetical protein [Chitinophaga nivalis]MCW3482483.1 hypothetical protein [Chitinophaga nivalis]
MAIMKYINRLKYIDYMIQRKATGNLDHFAKRNNVSRSTLSEILNDMKEMGYPIKYDRGRRTYYYEEAGEMISCLFLKYGEVLPREKMKQIGMIDKLCFSPTAVFELCK